MLRDNGGIRIHKGRSSHLKETAEIDNTTNLLTDRLEDLYQMFSHAVLHNHLGEIIVKLTKELTIKESDLWAKVKEVLIEIIMDIRSQTSYKQEASQFELYVLGPHTYLKALLKMRLNNSVIDNMYVAAPNPLVTGTKGEIE
jgi:siderophore synthetase component